jgi:hypothetical protein
MSDYRRLVGSHDPEFAAAVWKITDTLFPKGFDVLPAGVAPSTWEAVKDYAERTGRFAVSDSSDPENVFDSEATYHAFRAWHDWTHVYTGGKFTLLGEAVVLRTQEATLACMYGQEKARRWLADMHAEIITANFNNDPAAIDETHLNIA